MRPLTKKNPYRHLPDPNLKEKCCKNCELLLDIVYFYKRDIIIGGYDNICKKCHAVRCLPAQAKYKKKNAKLLSQQTIERNNRTPEARQARRDYSKEYNKLYPEVGQMHASSRRARKLQRTPKWLTKDDLRFIYKFYEESARLKKELNVNFEVDHIIPLKGKYMSGLHVPWNLRIITEEENLKRPKYIEPFYGTDPVE